MSYPNFFIDDSESMKYEETIDFFLSWTIRCADEIYKDENGIVNQYSKLILKKLLSNIYQNENPVFKNIRVWKQHSNIDLWIELNIVGLEKKISLIIENKMYSSIRNGQLEKYKKITQDFYKNKNEDPIIEFIFLRPDYEIGNKTNEKDFCEKLEYKYLNLEELKEVLPKVKTKNNLFDEFWFNWQ